LGGWLTVNPATKGKGSALGFKIKTAQKFGFGAKSLF